MLLNIKNRFLVSFASVFFAIVLLVMLVDVPRFFDETIKGPLRVSALQTAKIAIPLKDRILGRTIADKLIRIQTTRTCQICACQFCDLRNADFGGKDFLGADLRRTDLSGANLGSADLSRALLIEADLNDAYLGETNLTGANLTGANLTGANLTGANLTGANLTGVDLSGVDWTGATLAHTNLAGTNLTGVDLTGVDLTGENLTGVDFSGVDFSGVDLTGANLTGVDLSSVDLTGTTLVQTNLAGTNLNGVDLSGMDLTGANLTGVDLSGLDLAGANLTKTYLIDAKLIDTDLSEAKLVGSRISRADLTGANLRGADLGGLELNGIDGNLGKDLFRIKQIGNFSQVTSFDLSGDVHYFTTQSGGLYELKNEESRLLLDLNNDPKFFSALEAMGLFHVAANNDFIYLSYTIQTEDKRKPDLVVVEYQKTLQEVRTIIQIEIETTQHHGGALAFDALGKLYLSVGDALAPDDAQNLNSLLGKILRFDVSKPNPEPEVVAYGLRNPWQISIDSKNRMFIGDCGLTSKESVYLLEELYPTTPYNLGWPVFEGTERRKEDPLMFQDTLPPIYEYGHYLGIGGCVIGGFFLDTLQVYFFGDFHGRIRLLKEQKDGKWHEVYFQSVPTDIWSLGYNEETNQLFMSGKSESFKLVIPFKQINRLPQVRLCQTTMPSGAINNSNC